MAHRVVAACPNPECGEPVRNEDRYCEACGAKLPAVAGDTEAVAANGAGVRVASYAPPADAERVDIGFSDFAGVSDRGLRRRRNEDALALARVDEHDARVLVVCDGVATSAEPKLAAWAAAEAGLAYLVAAVTDGHPDREAAMREAVAAAQHAVCAVRYTPDPAGDPPATTFVAALIEDGRATIGWVGDSRAYFLGPLSAMQLSRDDSWAVEQVEEGRMTQEEASADPLAHALTSWLGGDQGAGPEPSVTTFPMKGSGCLLLCSDGLWNCAPEATRLRELVAELSPDATPLEVAQELTEFARSEGGNDNITVAIAFV